MTVLKQREGIELETTHLETEKMERGKNSSNKKKEKQTKLGT